VYLLILIIFFAKKKDSLIMIRLNIEIDLGSSVKPYVVIKKGLLINKDAKLQKKVKYPVK